MTHGQVISSGAAVQAPPSPRRLFIHSDSVAMLEERRFKEIEDCAPPYTIPPNSSAPADCDDVMVVGGVVHPYHSEFTMVLADAPTKAEERWAREWIKRCGGDLTGMSRWRTRWIVGRGRGHTFPIFIPTHVLKDKLEVEHICPGVWTERFIVRRLPMHKTVNKLTAGDYPGFAIHRHYQVPQSATACSEVLIGPVVRDLSEVDVIKRNGPFSL